MEIFKEKSGTYWEVLVVPKSAIGEKSVRGQ